MSKAAKRTSNQFMGHVRVVRAPSPRTLLLVVTFAIPSKVAKSRQIIDGIARSNTALRDRIWLCEIKYDLARSNMVLRDQMWPCEIKLSLARSILALRDQIWLCEIEYGLARSNMAL